MKTVIVAGLVMVAVRQARASTPGLRAPRTTQLPFLYGTAWKKEATKDLVVLAVQSGFRGIDTACQPKHYREDLVGAALEELSTLGVRRDDLWLQTKFTPIGGQDPNNVPYDRNAPLEQQVQQSIAKSLSNLRTDRVDSLVLHSPLRRLEDTLRVWEEFERAVDAGTVTQLGVSNCYDLGTFRKIYERARHKPRVLQNRFYRESGYDVELRQFCSEHDVVYQTFWTLTANIDALRSSVITNAARRLGVTQPMILFGWLIAQGHQPLTGTKDPEHMKQDLSVPDLVKLTRHESAAIAGLF